jgi:hypothetical protein
MDNTEMSEVGEDDGGGAGDAAADGSSPFPYTPQYAGGHLDHEYLDQWYGAYTAAEPGSTSSVTGEVLNAWFGADATMNPEAPKMPRDESLDGYAGEDGESQPWDEAESDAYA